MAEKNMSDLKETINEAAQFIRGKTKVLPQVGIILGTGLGSLADAINVDAKIPYEEIPHFPVSTVESHTGRLILGELSGRSVVAMQGRFHYYV